MSLRAVGAGPVLSGRAEEITAVLGLLDAARAGAGAALVLTGEAGIGKSALLARAAAAASGMRVLAGIGVQAEAELPFAGLHLLLRGVTDAETAALPPAQADALGKALGRGTAGQPPADRYLVGLALLTLLAELGDRRPVLCLVDDVHWFDHATVEVLAFVARRLAAESVAMLFAARDDGGFRAPGLPELALRRLDDDAARSVLGAHADDLPRHVRDLLLREAAGNPLALVELVAAHRAGRLTEYPFGPPDAGHGGTPPSGGRVEAEFAARVAAMPRGARTVLLVAAADGSCDTGLVLAAAARLGATLADLEVAERAGLIAFTSGCLGFPHPLIRAAVYARETLAAKQAAHRALAETIDEAIDPDRTAWHRAAATIGPDERTAAALEAAAERARDRGSPESAAAAYERAARLSARPRDRGTRLAAAAAAAVDAGRCDWAADLSRRAAEHLHDPVSRARLALIDAALADADNRADQAAELLFEPALAVAGADPVLAGDMLVWIVEAAWTTRDAAPVRRVVQAVRDLGLSHAEHVIALAEIVSGQLDETHRPARPPDAPPPLVCRISDAPRSLAKTARWSLALGDDRRAHELATAAERDARSRGQLGVLPDTLAVLAATRWHLGLHRDAVAAATEGLRIAREIGRPKAVGALSDVLAQLAAVSGDEVGCEAALVDVAAHRPATVAPTTAATARSLLDLGAGRFEQAADRLAGLVAAAAPEARAWLPDLVEAAARAGRPDQARAAAERFSRWAACVDLPWARAVALRCRALVADGPEAGRLFAEAVAVHRSEAAGTDPAASPTGSRPFERARTELLHGEWLRRARLRTAARAPLRSACETFDDLGATPWAARARAELRATGESRAEPPPDGLGALTPQELQVVRLAAGGLSNREIGAQLFLSPRTVAYHLHKAFPKLGVTTRSQLARLDLPA
ncbi:helix-turn-helix transcriptional regulator [Pseudonocardia humida]|uniref:AAA family ATPase n=1 Tax=Pseudonocardia humida TaxID=2800819 RepID=A0ABT0ZVW7_9PSEU|nr:LuxR family transcriptional regulator [Pseudonocardia humida]MCO1654809.1 AAA family ATPase [Pseudonocardia humida]